MASPQRPSGSQPGAEWVSGHVHFQWVRSGLATTGAIDVDKARAGDAAEEETRSEAPSSWASRPGGERCAHRSPRLT